MLKDDLQACLVSGYSFIGCSKFDQVDGYFGPGATQCHYRGVAEIALAQGACTFVETCTGGLQICTGSTRGLHRLEQGLALLHRLARGAFKIAQRLAQGACTVAQAAATWRGDGETLKMS